jgi:uncharacterized short protein YbdD (DUF466 family)
MTSIQKKSLVFRSVVSAQANMRMLMVGVGWYDNYNIRNFHPSISHR